MIISLKNKNDLAISLAKYDDAVYRLYEWQSKLHEYNMKLQHNKNQLKKDNQIRLRHLEKREEQIIKTEFETKQKWLKGPNADITFDT